MGTTYRKMKTVRKIKARYYSREILKYILLSGAIFIAASSPRLVLTLSRKIFTNKNIPKKKINNSFFYLKNKGYLELKKEGCDICISLTKEGKKKAGKYQIDDLSLEKPKKWDGKWRLVIFDIPNASATIRNVFRRKLKEFGFYILQKSVWIHPANCKEEITFLRNFLGVRRGQIQILEINKIENEDFLLKYFHVKHPTN